jgi:nucleotide-binding universal stress UspA family protein
MRALIWIVEESWKATVAAAAAILPADAEITLVYVTAGDAENVARGARHGLLGRPHRHSPEPLRTLSEQSAHDLLAEAQRFLGRPAGRAVRRGRVEREVVAAAEEMDVLILARDGDLNHVGPHSLGKHARFVVDHAPCAVLLVWPDPTAPMKKGRHRHP